MKHYGCSPSDLSPTGYDCTECCRQLAAAEKKLALALADIKWIKVCAEDMFREGDKGYQIAIFAREALAKLEKRE